MLIDPKEFALSGLPQVLHPTRTAAAIRVQMDGDDVFFRGKDRSGLQQRDSSRENHGSPRQPRIEIGHGGPRLGILRRLNGECIATCADYEGI